ncbi:efflux RND transporter periplasmic adaptor subunit [uncultured Enterovirga sp.]|uniref:efflux RND transporter periplasmic adaptor subunit n=1 Tax=uncultured Enterovirga sp. TaxID=2026352 RepID=UPI0035CC8340
MRRTIRTVAVLLLALGAGVFVWHERQPPTGGEPGVAPPAGNSRPGRRGGRRGGGDEGPVSVLTAPSRVEDVPVTLEAVGTAQALNTVTVRSQVDGKLLDIAYREGQDVKRGDVIARIDPAIYQAQYDQAVAKKAQDEANLANARIDLQRYVSLAATNAGSKQQADTQRAAVAQLEAQIKSDQGAIDNAKAYLDYTTVRAPIDGRLGIRLVDQGNLVRAGDSTGLVVITQLRPITILFNLPQQNLRAVNAAAAAGPLAVDALEADNRTVIDRGRLEVVDNQVDQATGTVKLKATFPNADLQLWPGSFVNVRITIDVLRQVVVVPTGAVQRGPTGTFVYGLDGDKAALKPVTVSRQTEILTVVTSGLTPPERVITTGFARLTNGDRVAVADPPASGDAPAANRAAPEGEAATSRRRRGREGGAADIPTSSTGEGRPGGEDRPRRNREGRAAREGRPAAAADEAAPPPTVTAPNPAAPVGTGSARP